jgi:hypothetical protein
MNAFRQLVGALAILVVVAACASSKSSVEPATSIAPSVGPGAEPSVEPSAQPSEPSAEPSGVPNAATWWVDTTLLPLAPETTEVKAILVEQACASGKSPEGRVGDPVIRYGPDAVIVTVPVTPLAGDQDCQGNPEFPINFTLSEPLGSRALLDGSSNPPRDATTTP